MSELTDDEIVEEAHKQWQHKKDQLIAIQSTEGYKFIVEWFTNEEQSLDNKLTVLKGQDLEVAVLVRKEIKNFLNYLKNQTI